MTTKEQKSLVLKTFNKELTQFLDELTNVIPDNTDIKQGKRSHKMMSKLNPSMIIKSWQIYVNDPYYDQIMSSDLDFFLNKDYTQDMENLGSKESLDFISKIKTPVKNLDEKNKQTAFNYIQNLCKLADAYNQLSN